MGRSARRQQGPPASVDETPAPEGWLFLSPNLVPDDWRDRSIEMALVPLLAEEAERVLGGHPASPEMSAGESELVKLVAAGASAPEIARSLGISVRSAERRLAELRDRFGAGSSAELVAYLARRGF
jgi:DNA-binding CsgD family transcriptional regulator